MKAIKTFSSILPAALFAGLLSSCGGSDSIESGDTLLTCSVPQVPNAAGTQCVDPEPIDCPVPTVPDELNETCIVGVDPNAPDPDYFPQANEAVLYYNRPQDGVYDGYRLHTWNDEACDSYAASAIAPSWDNGLEPTGFDPVYGAYWVLELKDDYDDCGNFIIHIGTDDAGKEMGGIDWQMNLVQDDPVFVRMNFTFSGEASIYEYPVPSLGEPELAISGASAHWLDVDTLVWDIDPASVASVKLHYSMTAELEAADNAVNGSTIDFEFTTLTEAQQARIPHMADWPAFRNMTDAETAKSVAKAQLAAVAYDDEGNAIEATWVQQARLLDALYTMADNDADEASLGALYDGGDIQVNLWAPTAHSVTLNVYDASKTLSSSHPMTENTDTGIWTVTGDSAWDRQFYRFELTVYHPVSGELETIESTDPYSVSLSANGRYSQFVNLDDADLKPEAWDDHAVPTVTHFEDAVILEAHIRDFSVRDETVSAANRGKYLAFTEAESDAVHYLQRLVTAGLTHFHMLPANDIATVEELAGETVNLNNTVAELCELNDEAPVCGVESDSATLLSVLESYQYDAEAAQALVASMRDLDSFNWGYDPQHFNAPEGSYASDPDGETRILEMRAMNKALHDMGLRVVLDVVYNHTSASGLWDNSVLDKVVPGYYHRLNEQSGSVERSSCCENTATENRMMAKLISDSLVLWAQAYGFDAFRFDIMGHIPADTILAARDAVAAVDPDTYFYGEGWNFGDDVQNDRIFVQATQDNMAGSEVGTFNDRPRDDIRNADLFREDGSLDAQDHIRLGLAGTLADFVLENNRGVVAEGRNYARASYALDPADIINYVSKHDNRSLWDELQWNLPENPTLDERVRMHNIAATIPLLSQGIPFFQLGVDMLRSKSMDRNSYNSGDWFNHVDYTMTSNNWNVGLPLAQDNSEFWEEIYPLSARVPAATYLELDLSTQVFAEFLSIRSASPLFRLTTAEDVIDRVGFHNIGTRQTQGLIVMSIDDGTGLTDLDPAYDALVVVINGTGETQSHTVATAAGFTLHPVQQASADMELSAASFSEGEGEGTFTVPPLTTAVFVKVQGDAQGAGLAADVTQGAPDVVPYGDVDVLLRGDMNGWTTDDAFTYVGNGAYQIAVQLDAATTYNFKVADAEWGALGVNFGGADGGDGLVVEGEAKALFQTNTNLNFTPGVSATYLFTLDASDAAAPVLTVVNEEPYPGTVVYLRGDMNDWGTSGAFTYAGDRIYTYSATLAAGTYGFKVASEDWATVNFGAETDAEPAIVPGDEVYLAATNNNLSLSLEAETELVFIFDMSDADEPKLRVFDRKFYGETSVYLRGDMNAWGTSDVFTYADGAYSISVALDAGSYNFKFADADWASINYGPVAADQVDVVLGQAQATLYNSPNNFRITVESAATYTFTILGPDGSQPELLVTVE